jgi:hypothetical protein
MHVDQDWDIYLDTLLTTAQLPTFNRANSMPS